MTRPLAGKGEIVIGPEVSPGKRVYGRVRQDGALELGTAVGPDHPEAHEGAGYLDVSEEEVRPGVRRVNADVRFNAPGSGVRSRPATSAYRSGWDAVFAAKGARSCGPS